MADDFLCLKEVEKEIQLALPLTYIGNEKAGVLEILESWKRQYNHQLEGILISCKNVSLLSQNVIVMEKYCIQICVKAKFNLFCPVVGAIIKGKINRISKEHIGCLVHDTINVAIKLKEYCPSELNKFIRLEQEILFEIANFCVQRTEIRMKGKITPECLRLMDDLFPVTEEEITNYSFQSLNSITQYDFNDFELNLMDVKKEKITSSSSSEHEDEQKKHKIVKSKKLISPEDVVNECFSKKEENNLLNVHSNGTESSKARKKRESTDDETSTDSSQNQDFDVSSLSQFSSELKTKKSKLDPSSHNHVSKKKKPKKEKGDKKKSHKSKKSKLKLKKKRKTLASGEILKKDKKKHKSKHLSKNDTHKLESKSNKKHSKKKKSEYTNDILKNVSIKSEHL